MSQFTLVLAYAVAALGLNLLLGYSGQISLGHGAFFALGAYTTAILVAKAGWPHLATVPVAAASASPPGFLVGLPALRLRGLYLALVTLGLAVADAAADQALRRADRRARRASASPSPRPRLAASFLADDQCLYLLNLAIAVAMFVLAARDRARARRPRAGRDPRQRDRRAAVRRRPRARTRRGAFAISAAYAGVGGVDVRVLDRLRRAGVVRLGAVVLVPGRDRRRRAGDGRAARCSARCSSSSCPVYAADVDEALAAVIYGGVLILVHVRAAAGVVGLLRRLGARVRPHATKEESMRWLGRCVAVLALALALAAGAGGAMRTRRRWRRGRRGGARDHRQLDQARRLAIRSAARRRPTRRSPRARRRASTAENAKGGIDGRKIEFVTLDDGYEPQRAVTNARRLVEQEKVFALFNTLGTPNNLAIWDYPNQQKVPHVFVATGASSWGADLEKHPYTIGWQPDYVSEAKAYAEFLKTEKPNAKVAVLFQNDGFGKDLLGGFERGDRGLGHQDRRARELRGDRPDDHVADAQAGGLGRRHVPEHHDAEVLGAGDRGGRQVRLEAAAHPQQRRRLEEARARAGRPRERQGHRLDGATSRTPRTRSGPTTRR